MVSRVAYSHEKINTFRIDGTYFFTHGFEGDDIYAALAAYYNEYEYRFEVPPEDVDEIRHLLATYEYWLVTREAYDEYVVLVDQTTPHPDDIVRESVTRTMVDDYNCFLLPTTAQVETAVAAGALPLDETSVENPFPA